MTNIEIYAAIGPQVIAAASPLVAVFYLGESYLDRRKERKKKELSAVSDPNRTTAQTNSLSRDLEGGS
jgi:hypothetical protein